MLDLVILCIIILFGIIGYYTGLVKTIITLISSIVALILSFLMYPVVNTLLKLTPIYTYMNKWIGNRLTDIDFGTRLQSQGNVITNNITWLPKFMSEQIVKNNNQEVYKLLEVSNVKDYVSIYVTNIVIGMLAILITWLFLNILLAFFLKTAHALVSHLPVVSQVNKLGGGVIGIAKGLMIIWGIYLLVPIFITNPSFYKINEYMSESYLAKWLYENNMILIAFNSIFNV
jgi:hypothetical protein